MIQPSQNPFDEQFSLLLSHVSAAVARAAASLTPRVDSAIEKLCSSGQWPLQSEILCFAGQLSTFRSSWRRRTAGWAKIPILGTDGCWPEVPIAQHRFDLALSGDSMEERLAGIPVYALSNSAEEFVLVSGVKTAKSLGLFCFRREDAEVLLKQMGAMNPGMQHGSKVVAVALNKVFQLKVDGVAFRFIPDTCQIMNAIKVKQQIGNNVEDFCGIPVFQSRSLVLKSQNKRYRPVFFRKEDLEESLFRASRQQNYLNPTLRRMDVQVSALEKMIAAMKADSTSKWEDVVFIPPGFTAGFGLLEHPIVTA